MDLIDRFFDGELDQTMFEEKTRYIFVTEAHVLFTIDKLIHSVIKQVSREEVVPNVIYRLTNRVLDTSGHT